MITSFFYLQAYSVISNRQTWTLLWYLGESVSNYNISRLHIYLIWHGLQIKRFQQWSVLFQAGGCQAVYIIYRLFWAFFWIGIFIYDLIDEPHRHRFPIFLTNWAYILLGISAIFQCISAVYGAVHDKRIRGSSKTPVLYQVTWFFYSAASTSAIIVSLLYWLVIYDGKTTSSSTWRHFVCF